MEKLNLTFLGESRKGSKLEQIKYCCPFCDDSDFHLGVHLVKRIFHCFHCGISGKTDNLTPALNSFKRRVEDYFKLKGQTSPERKEDLKLPYSFQTISPTSGLPFRYLCRRKITIPEIKKYHIGYCPESTYEERIIVPIYDDYILKYYVGRSYTNRTPKYMNAMVQKRNTIFRTHGGTPTKVVVVEGVFDAIRVGKVMPAVAILGKEINQGQVKAISEYASEAIVLLDPDAKQYGISLMSKLGYYMRISLKFLEKGDPGSTSVSELRRLLNE